MSNMIDQHPMSSGIVAVALAPGCLQEKGEQLVILTQVLAHDLTVGYEDLENMLPPGWQIDVLDLGGFLLFGVFSKQLFLTPLPVCDTFAPIGRFKSTGPCFGFCQQPFDCRLISVNEVKVKNLPQVRSLVESCQECREQFETAHFFSKPFGS